MHSNNRGAQAFRRSDIRKGDGSLAKVRYETSRPNYIDSNPSACSRHIYSSKIRCSRHVPVARCDSLEREEGEGRNDCKKEDLLEEF